MIALAVWLMIVADPYDGSVITSLKYPDEPACIAGAYKAIDLIHKKDPHVPPPLIRCAQSDKD
jgi:hypothetical protein